MGFIAYSDKSAAKRGFSRKYKEHGHTADASVFQKEGKWGFADDLQFFDIETAPFSKIEEPVAPKIDYVWPGTDNSASICETPICEDEEIEPCPAADHFTRFALSQLTPDTHSDSIPFESLSAPVSAKIEKNRVEQNGVKRPSSGTTCSAVWEIASSLSNIKDSTVKSDGYTSRPIATLSQVIKASEAKGINKFTARTQYARWRVFHGITGRRV